MSEKPENRDLKKEFARAASYHPNFFPAEAGIDAQKYHRGEKASYAGVRFFHEQGWIHGVHADVTPSGHDVKIEIDHWVHRPDGTNIVTRFLELQAERQTDKDGLDSVIVKKALLQGRELDISSPRALDQAVTTCQQIMEQLRINREMPLLNIIAERNGLKPQPLPATYEDGNARLAYESGRKKTEKALRVPEQFLMALTGFNEAGEDARPGDPVLFSATQHDPGNAGREYTLYTEMMKGAAGADATSVSLRLARKQHEETAEEPYNIQQIASLTFKPCAEAADKGLVELSEAQIDGRTLPQTDHQSMVRALDFVRGSTVQAEAGIMPDMADILNRTSLQSAVSGLPALTSKEKQRYTYRVLGGTPSGPRLFKQDGGIGANCFLHLYEWYDDKKKYHSDALMVDFGITPLPRKKTNFDGMMAFAGDYFEHRSNPKHQPKHKVSTLVVTHHHLDHYMGIPHLLLAGYVVDHIVCNQPTREYIEDECKKLEVPPEYMPKKWTVVDKEMDLKAGAFDLSFGWIPHSAITNWVCVKTPEGKVFHYSDAKVDPTVQSHPPANEARIAAQKPTLAIVDSTRAHQDDQTRSEKELEDEIVEFLNANPGKGAIGFHISSNAARMATFVNAYGRTGRNTVVFGASKQKLKKIMDNTGLRSGFGLKAHAAKDFGTQVVNYSPSAKIANEIIAGPPEQQGLLGTGTHNEPGSIINRLIENKDRARLGFITPDKYVVVLSQTGIAENAYKWNEVKQWLERRGFEYKVIHASGHEGKKGIEKMLDWVQAPAVAVTHGSPEQRAAAEKIVTGKNLKAINPDEQDVIQVSDKKGCKVVAQDPSTMVYYSIKRPEGQPWGGGEDVEYYTYDLPPEIHSPAGEMLKDIHRIKSAAGYRPSHAEQHFAAALGKDPVPSAQSPAILPSQQRVKVSLPDHLVKNGILRRMVYDCETSQLGRYAWITQFAARRTDWADENAVKEINIRQTLPEKVLPDLEALLATGMKPSQLYATGKDYYQPRRFYHEVAKFFKESKQFGSAAQTKIWIDRAQVPADPSTETAKPKKGEADPYMRESLQYSFQKEASFADPKWVNTKTLVGGFNNTRSDDMWLQQAAFRAGTLSYFPTNTGGMQRFDLRNMSRLFAYLVPDKFKTRPSPRYDGPDFSVKGVMEANNLSYDAKGAHDADADVAMEDKAILEFMLKSDPELFTQGVLNADPKEVKMFLNGAHNGWIYQRPLVTYINSGAVDAKANIGAYVGRSTEPKYKNRALIFNVADFDPRDFEGMSAQQFADVMGNPKHPMHKAFEIVQINQNPLLASADRGLAVGANHGASLEAMRSSKHFIERNPVLAAEMVKGMEKVRHIPEADPKAPMEERVYGTAFMEMSSHDKALAKLFEPNDLREFTDAKFADSVNKDRARAIDRFHDTRVRERYVAVLYQAEREYETMFGRKAAYLHPEDRAREKAKEKARIHGLIDPGPTPPVSLGHLDSQIKSARKNWDEMMKDKTPEKRKLCEEILKETEALVQDIKMKIANHDPDWDLSAEDFRLLGLDDNKPYGQYRPPVAETASSRQPGRKPPPDAPKSALG